MALLECRNLTVSYGLLPTVQDASLEVEAGATVGIVGPNGAGKTSLLRGICGLEACRSGSVWFDGREITGRSTADLARDGISLVPAGRQLFPQLSVRKNLWLGAHVRTARRSERPRVEADLRRIYEMFPVLRQREQQAAGSLSGGEQQMLAIGRALMRRPRLLLLDEPSLGLAPLVLRDIFDALRRLVAESAVTVVLVEQNAELALSFVSKIYVLEAGRVVASGAPSDIEFGELAGTYLGGHA